MRNFYFLFLFFTCFSCSKNNAPAPQLPPVIPGIELSATVLFEDQPEYTFTANSNNTVFGRTTDLSGNVLISVAGSSKSGQVGLHLANVLATGIYDLRNGNSFCDFVVGNPFVPTNIYFSDRGNGSGQLTIEKIDDKTIRGKFNAVCYDANNKKVEIKNASFNGKFQ